MKRTRPTYTSLVFELLIAKDDALTVQDIARELHLKGKLVSSVLHTLYHYHAVDVIEGRDSLWWYATPEEDRRTRTFAEREDRDEHRAPHKPGRPYSKPHKRNERPKRD